MNILGQNAELYQRHVPEYRLLTLLISIAALAALFLSNFAGYVLFHTLVEFYSIVIGFCILVIAWNTRRFLPNDGLIVIGIGFGCSAGLDLLHTLAYPDLRLFPGFAPQLTAQFWIAARCVQAVTFLIAPIFLKHRINTLILVLGYFAVFSALTILIFTGRFPDCFISGQGMTRFKIISEYVIIVICFISLRLFSINRQYLHRRVYLLLAASVICTISAEMTFTAWKTMYDYVHMLGHFLKIATFYLAYRALLVTGMTEPFDLIFRDLRQTEQVLRNQQDTLEEQVRERTAALESINRELGKEICEREKAEKELRQSEKYKAIQNQIANIFLTVPDEEMYAQVLTVVLQVLKSKFGVFGFIGTNGDLIIPSMTTEIWDKCRMSDKSVVFPRNTCRC